MGILQLIVSVRGEEATGSVLGRVESAHEADPGLDIQLDNF